MENPGALAGATGATAKAVDLQGKPYRKPNRGAMARYAKDRHKRAAKVLGYALTLDEPRAWNEAGSILALRLTRQELASLAFATLRALDAEAREMVFDAAYWGNA